MAKTIEQLQDAVTAAEDAFKKAQARYTRARNALKKAREAEEAQLPMTIERALVTYLPGIGENEAGYKFLQNLAWKGYWHRLGISTSGCWQATNQYTVRIAINHTRAGEELAATAAELETLLPLIKVGAYEDGEIKLSKTEIVAAKTMKIIDIFEHGLSESGNWVLGPMQDGRWVVFDTYHMKYSWGGNVRKVGTLMECLEVVRDTLWYGGREEGRDDDDDC